MYDPLSIYIFVPNIPYNICCSSHGNVLERVLDINRLFHEFGITLSRNYLSCTCLWRGNLSRSNLNSWINYFFVDDNYIQLLLSYYYLLSKKTTKKHCLIITFVCLWSTCKNIAKGEWPLVLSRYAMCMN
jgi:hypothetical protein